MTEEWLICVCGQEVSCYHGSCLELMGAVEEDRFHRQKAEQSAWHRANSEGGAA